MYSATFPTLGEDVGYLRGEDEFCTLMVVFADI
jgi:hypothetical protein